MFNIKIIKFGCIIQKKLQLFYEFEICDGKDV